MEFISGIVWRNLNKATFDTLNNRSPGQYDIRLGSADYSAFFDGLPRENATNIGGFSLTVPLTSFPTADTGASTPLVVRYMGNDSSRRDWNIPSQRSATAYSLWRPDRRLPDAPSDKSFLVLLKTYSGKYYGRLILARELDYLPEDLKDLLLSNERGCRMLATASPQALDLYLTLLRALCPPALRDQREDGGRGRRLLQIFCGAGLPDHQERWGGRAGGARGLLSVRERQRPAAPVSGTRLFFPADRYDQQPEVVSHPSLL